MQRPAPCWLSGPGTARRCSSRSAANGRRVRGYPAVACWKVPARDGRIGCPASGHAKGLRVEAHALAGLGRCALAAGRTTEAQDRLRHALAILRRIGAAEAPGVSAELDALLAAPDPGPSSPLCRVMLPWPNSGLVRHCAAGAARRDRAKTREAGRGAKAEPARRPGTARVSGRSGCRLDDGLGR
jgi:hypothetical protein